MIFLFSLKIVFDILMTFHAKCESLFSGINRKNTINLLSAEFAQRMVMFNRIGFDIFCALPPLAIHIKY